MTPILVMEPTQYLDVKKVIVVTGYRFRDGQGQSLPIGKEEGIGGPALFAALVPVQERLQLESVRLA